MSDWNWIKVAAPLMVGFGFLVLWHMLVVVNNIPPYIVPGPLLVLQTLAQEWQALFASLLITLQVTASALLLAVVLGSLLSNALSRNR